MPYADVRMHHVSARIDDEVGQVFQTVSFLI